MKSNKPIQLRYTVGFELSDGHVVGIEFDYLKEAIEFAKRINPPGEWWEVLDNKTMNVVASAKED
jgi:hypothetical protein